MLATRRIFLSGMLGLASAAVLRSRRVFAEPEQADAHWNVFVTNMQTLADQYAAKSMSGEAVSKQGLRYLQAVDINSASFADALDAAYESGNQYWLWQRMLKQRNVNGGILNIDKHHIVQLHDHPGAIGMLRIISGEAEVWQYLRKAASADEKTAQLELVSRRVLRSGDTAVLSSLEGDIHALRSVSDECRMLDFFIPPYQHNQRTWFEPLTAQWQEQQQIICRCIPQSEHANT